MDLREALQKRLLILDGAMGTQIQTRHLKREDYHGTRFANHPQNLQGLNDLLTITRPDVIASIHSAYLEAGADIIETNTFNSQVISLADYGMESMAPELCKAAAQLARECADRYTRENPEKPRFVAGILGPTNRSASISPDVADPSARNIDFDTLVKAYTESACALIDGGVDALLIETVFDTLNCKAAIYACEEAQRLRGSNLPLMISATLSNNAGRLLSGQTLEAFYASVAHADLMSIGLNCAFGVAEMRPHIETLSRLAKCAVSAHPNAGLPNESGGYDQSPEFMAEQLHAVALAGHLNIVGGCCGTSPAHIKAIADAVRGIAPRKIPNENKHICRLSGLESLNVTSESLLVQIGERCNVAGSAKFRRLIRAKDYAAAVETALAQVENGALILDINIDDPLFSEDDAKAVLTEFLRRLGSEPTIAKVPMMLDSSRFAVLEAGLKCLQGKGIVNSISLKEGEAAFVEHARTIRRYGAAVVVMAFDEKGQADTLERRIEICERSYNLLISKANFSPEDIIFDPNMFAIGTGIPAHDRFAIDFLEATKWVKKNLPYASISCGLSNLSFAFKGNDALRAALHTVFLYHAVQAGMGFAIAHAGQIGSYDAIPEDLRNRLEDLIFARRADATDRVLEIAESLKGQKVQNAAPDQSWRQGSPAERIAYALLNGVDQHIAEDVEAARLLYAKSTDVIEGPLMDGMNAVGERFRAGKMFLPQVIKSARVMKLAVETLQPYIEAERSEISSKNGKILLATVKGDVHDIGKNIVSLVLECNGYEVIDLGVMVPTEEILQRAQDENVDAVALSGLITPSLEHMADVARGMERLGWNKPLLIGGATTSKRHTALHLAPLYQGPVVHCPDPQSDVAALGALLGDHREQYFNDLKAEQAQIQNEIEEHKTVSIELARQNKLNIDWQTEPAKKPNYFGVLSVTPEWKELVCRVNFGPLLKAFGLQRKSDAQNPDRDTEVQELLSQARELLATPFCEPRGVYGIFHARAHDETIELFGDAEFSHKIGEIETTRQLHEPSNGNPNLALADFIAPNDDALGLFVVTAGEPKTIAGADPLLIQALADRIAEAAAEYMHEIFVQHFFQNAVSKPLPGIRPAPGYPACPNHAEKQLIFSLLGASEKLNVSLTESYAMLPKPTIAGYFFTHQQARYFNAKA